MRLRFKPFTIRQDPEAAEQYEAVCVAGDDADCGASSGKRTDPDPVELWMIDHTARTGHERFRRTFSDYAVTGALTASPPSRRSDH